MGLDVFTPKRTSSSTTVPADTAAPVRRVSDARIHCTTAFTYNATYTQRNTPFT